MAELLFSQMLALPQPQYKPIAYSCLIVRARQPCRILLTCRRKAWFQVPSRPRHMRLQLVPSDPLAMCFGGSAAAGSACLLMYLEQIKSPPASRGRMLFAGRPVQSRKGVPKVNEWLCQGAVRPHGGAPDAVYVPSIALLSVLTATTLAYWGGIASVTDMHALQLSSSLRPCHPAETVCSYQVFSLLICACLMRQVMDTELRGRCTEWLAFQLSNFDFVWPWHKWLHVLKAPPHSAQRRSPTPRRCSSAWPLSDAVSTLSSCHSVWTRTWHRMSTGVHCSLAYVSLHMMHSCANTPHRRFVAAVLDRMVRLSYYDNVIQKTDKVTIQTSALGARHGWHAR